VPDPAPPDPAVVERVADLLAGADSVLFITGAGLSADSGLPTYRGVGGLYDQGETEEGLPIEVLLSGQMFSARPEVSWRYIRQIEEACRGAGPNRAHEVMAELERRLPRVWVLTQNVDGFHRAAGSDNVIAIHGDVGRLRCTRCTWREEVEDLSGLPALPTCPRCAAVIRPDVVLFGEMLPESGVAAMARELSRGFDVVFSVGTSSLFPYIIRPVLDARSQGIPTVEVNPGDTEVSLFVDHRLRTGARVAFEAVWEAFLARTGDARF